MNRRVSFKEPAASFLVKKDAPLNHSVIGTLEARGRTPGAHPARHLIEQPMEGIWFSMQVIFVAKRVLAHLLSSAFG